MKLMLLYEYRHRYRHSFSFFSFLFFLFEKAKSKRASEDNQQEVLDALHRKITLAENETDEKEKARKAAVDK